MTSPSSIDIDSEFIASMISLDTSCPGWISGSDSKAMRLIKLIILLFLVTCDLDTRMR
jgi:hypothetical protein